MPVSQPPPPPPPSPSLAPAQPRPRTARRRVTRLPLGLAVKRTIAAAAVASALIFSGLTLQMANGQDPTLGSQQADGSQQAPSPTQLTEDDDQVATPTVPAPAPTTVPTPAPVQTATS